MPETKSVADTDNHFTIFFVNSKLFSGTLPLKGYYT